MRGAPKARRQPMSALRGWLSEFTICMRDGVTNGNKCVSFMGNMWESSCPRLGDSAGVDCLEGGGGSPIQWMVNAGAVRWENVCGMGRS